jgi:hypothetical protein
MIVWALIVGLNVDGADARHAVNQYPTVEICETEGKKWAAALSKLVIGTKVEYTVACVQQDFVIVATGRDPMKI